MRHEHNAHVHNLTVQRPRFARKQISNPHFERYEVLLDYQDTQHIAGYVTRDGQQTSVKRWQQLARQNGLHRPNIPQVGAATHWSHFCLGRGTLADEAQHPTQTHSSNTKKWQKQNSTIFILWFSTLATSIKKISIISWSDVRQNGMRPKQQTKPVLQNSLCVSHESKRRHCIKNAVKILRCCARLPFYHWIVVKIKSITRWTERQQWQVISILRGNSTALSVQNARTSCSSETNANI